MSGTRQFPDDWPGLIHDDEDDLNLRCSKCQSGDLNYCHHNEETRYSSIAATLKQDAKEATMWPELLEVTCKRCQFNWFIEPYQEDEDEDPNYAPPPPTKKFFVDPGATKDGDGESVVSPSKDLPTAIDEPTSVFIMPGTYKAKEDGLEGLSEWKQYICIKCGVKTNELACKGWTFDHGKRESRCPSCPAEPKKAGKV